MKTIKKVLAILGCTGLGVAVSAPAMAIPAAFISGSATIVLMNGASNSVGAEVGLPGNGSYFDTPVTVDPTYDTNLATNDNLISEIQVLGTYQPPDPANPGTFTGAAAAELAANTGDLQAVVSIIRAGAGVDGLE